MLAYAVISIIVAWVLIHLFVRSLANDDASILPTTTRGRSGFPRSSKTDVTVKYVHLKIETTRWNRLHDWASQRLASKRHAKQRAGLELFYDAGVVVGGLGMLAAIGLVSWTCFRAVVVATSPPEATTGVLLSKRSELEQVPQSTVTVQAIIPGVTVPFSHIVPILVSLFVCQVIHELGHAVAGALDFISIQSCGVSLTLLIPSAFVAFPSQQIDSLKPLARGRVIAGGAWHNAVLWLVLLGMGWLRITHYALTVLGYEDISDVGRVVVSVQSDSTLSDYLPRRSIITHVDDTFLGGEEDHWTAYMTGPQQDLLGWCIPQNDFYDTPETCCVADLSVALLSCFNTAIGQGCVDPVPILTKPAESLRCHADSECRDAICARPDAVAQLLRLTVRTSTGDEVILWRGSKEEVWEEVELGPLRPRIYILPMWIPSLVLMFETYMKMITMSLFLFNLLPLPLLDGLQFLDVLLDLVFVMSGVAEGEGEDIEMGMGMIRENGRMTDWKGHVRGVVRGWTMGCVAVSVLLGMWNAL